MSVVCGVLFAVGRGLAGVVCRVLHEKDRPQGAGNQKFI